MDPVTLLGVLGATLLVVAFSTNQLDYISDDSKIYVALNLCGAGILVVYAYLIASYPFLILNIVWTGVALRQMLKF